MQVLPPTVALSSIQAGSTFAHPNVPGSCFLVCTIDPSFSVTVPAGVVVVVDVSTGNISTLDSTLQVQRIAYAATPV